jgi:hypothetical protein
MAHQPSAGDDTRLPRRPSLALLLYFDAAAKQVEGRFMSAFVRATKPR